MTCKNNINIESAGKEVISVTRFSNDFELIMAWEVKIFTVNTAIIRAPSLLL